MDRPWRTGCPVKPGSDGGVRRNSHEEIAEYPAYPFFFTSFTAENSIPSARSLV